MIGRRAGSYVIESELGQGGMGAVYVARHAMLGRMAAIKILLPQFSATPEIIQRFFNEARAATEIRHMGIVEIYDYGQMEDGSAFIAMELLSGESLASRMRKRGQLGILASLRLIRQMCGPLAAAHERGIVHRDLKPDNVFIVPDAEVVGGERIKLLDFGIAKVATGNNAMQTSTGAIMGTPMYMAPEQCRGVPVDHRADIYALGCILFELIRQRTPFLGEGAGDIMGAHMFQEAPPLGTSNQLLEALVAKMLAKQPGDRPQTVRDVADAIDAILADAARQPIEQTMAAAPSGATVATISPRTPVPATGPERQPPIAAPVQTTLSASAGEPASRPRKGRGLIIGGAVVLVVTAGATYVVTRGNSQPSGSEQVAAVTPPSPSSSAAALDAPTTPVDAPPIDAPSIDAPPVDAPAQTEKTSQLSVVTIDSTPRGATVLLDGRSLGTTKLKKSLAAGTYTFTLRRGGYEDKLLTVTVDGKTSSSASGALIPKAAAATDRPPRDSRPSSVSTPQNRGSDDAVNPFP